MWKLSAIEYKRFLGYKCDTPEFESNFMFSVPNVHANTMDLKVGFENQSFKVINLFEFEGITYCNCLDKNTQKVFLMNCWLASNIKKYTYLSVNIRIQIRNIMSKYDNLLPKYDQVFIFKLLKKFFWTICQKGFDI